MDATPEKSKARWGFARVAFFAIRDELETAIAKGYPVTALYEMHRARLPMCYSAFARLVQRHITNNPAQGSSPGRRTSRRPLPAAPVPDRQLGAEFLKELSELV